VGLEIVEQIQISVNAFYSQFDDAGQLPDSPGQQEPDEQIEGSEQDLSASEADDQPETEQSAALMPGLPVEGADGDDFDSGEEMDLPDDFDNMELAGSVTEAAEAETEAAAANEELPEETPEESPEVLDHASREPSVQGKTPPAEEIGDELMTSKE